MSIKSKDLSYDKAASQPAFLQRLRDQNSAIDASGRHERPVARAQRIRSNKDDEEDAPAYVLEGSSETLTKAEYEKLTLGGEGAKDVDAKFGSVKDMVTGELQGQSPKASGALPDEEDETKGVTTRKPGTVDAGTGASKKRKMAKVVGGDDADEDQEAAGSKEHIKPKKIKKKGKPIKLSFGDEE